VEDEGKKEWDSCLVPGRWIGALAAVATQASAMLFGVDLIRSSLAARAPVEPDATARFSLPDA